MKKLHLTVIIFLFAAGFLFFNSEAVPETLKAIELKGDVRVIAQGMAGESTVKNNILLKTGDRIFTGEESFVVISAGEDLESVIKIGEKSDVILLFDEHNDLELINGEVYVVINSLGKGDMFTVKTPCAVCGARGTGWKTSTDDQNTYIASFDDKVFVFGINQDGTLMGDIFWIKEGYERKVEKFLKPGKMIKLNEEDLARMKEEMKNFLKEGQKKDKNDILGALFSFLNFGKKEKAEKFEKLMEKADIFDDERMKGIVEDKDDRRTETDDDRTNSDNGGSEGKFVITHD